MRSSKSPWSTRGRRSSASPALLVALAGVVLTTFLLVRLRAAESQLADSRAWTRSLIDSLTTSLEELPPPVGSEGRDSLYWRWVAVETRMESRRLKSELREVQQRRGDLLTAADLAQLKDSGLRDPAAELRDSLRARPDLVPFKDRGGSRMGFVPDRIVLLEPPYVFAHAGNGPKGGDILLAYDVRPGRVRWR
ncbi:MAG: hypothetical protein E6K80_06710, partial [Candidatus Eisenbacteria bacterium]